MTAKEFYNKRTFKHQLNRAIKHDKQYFEDTIIELMEMYAQEQVKNSITPVINNLLIDFWRKLPDLKKKYLLPEEQNNMIRDFLKSNL